MEKNGELEGVKAIKNIADDWSWFRDTPHYWTEASLPVAYAVACVEVVCRNSEKARILYNRIVENPDLIESDSYALTIGQTWGCLIVVNVASNAEPSVSILPCSVP